MVVTYYRRFTRESRKVMKAFFFVALAALAFSAAAQTYPAKPVRIVVPFAACGALDVVGRVIGAKLSESWNRQVVIDNRLGAAGNIGAE